MYGTRDAGQNWANECANVLITIASAQARASPCILYHKERGIRTFVHGDDYVSAAMPNQLEWLNGSFGKETSNQDTMVRIWGKPREISEDI